MDAHAREYAAAVAGMTETYGAWTPRPGDRVRCPQAFGGGHQEGTVHCREQAGTYLVDTPEGRLRLNAEELEEVRR